MEENNNINNNKKKIVIVVFILLLLCLVSGATFALWAWDSTSNTAVYFTTNAGFSCMADGGGNITSSDTKIAPVNCTNSEHAIKREITVGATLDASTPVYMDLWLDINSIDSGLTNSENFMYAITTSDTSCENPIKSGSFNGKVATNKVDLLKGIEFTATGTDTYYLWIWLDIDEESTSTMKQTFDLSLNGSCTTEVPPLTTFATDSWATIKTNISSGKTYELGSTKCVALNGFTTSNNNGCSNGEFLVRVANTSTPEECSGTDFSQSACGFVVEFVDIITTHSMNSTLKNAGGWPASVMKSYLDTTIYNALPSDLQSSIITTKTVSGHGFGDTSGTLANNNFESNDKLYLLATHEIWEDDDGNTSSGIDYRDTAYNNTRQLDYYAGLGITTSNYSGAIKKLNGTDKLWWLRGAYSDGTKNFFYVSIYGGWDRYSANFASGVAPAFRVG